MKDSEFRAKWIGKIQEINNKINDLSKFDPDWVVKYNLLCQEKLELLKKFNAAKRRRIKDQVHESLGMKRVKGNLGGTYYE